MGAWGREACLETHGGAYEEVPQGLRHDPSWVTPERREGLGTGARNPDRVSRGIGVEKQGGGRRGVVDLRASVDWGPETTIVLPTTTI